VIAGVRCWTGNDPRIKRLLSRYDTNIAYVVLQTCYLLDCDINPLSEPEIILLSGVINSGAGYIIQAGGGGSSGHWLATGVDAQPLSTSANATLKPINSGFSIG